MFSKVVSPEYYENIINYTVEMDKMTLEEAKAYFNFKSYMIQSIIGAPIMGIITSAIVAIFVKKK